MVIQPGIKIDQAIFRSLLDRPSILVGGVTIRVIVHQNIGLNSISQEHQPLIKVGPFRRTRNGGQSAVRVGIDQMQADRRSFE